MSTEIEIQVECYAGYRGEQHPQRFALGQRMIEVKEIIDQWYGPDDRYFKLKGDDGGVYVLRNNEKSQCWKLTMFHSGSRDQTRLSST